jgi:hypothetical protein
LTKHQLQLKEDVDLLLTKSKTYLLISKETTNKIKIKMDNFDLKKFLAEGKLLKENIINNKYVVKDEEESDEYGDFYRIDLQKALDYLSQFNNEEVDAEQFINDDEGWGEFEQYLEDVKSWPDKELEDAMRQEMSFYYYSDGDSI